MDGNPNGSEHRGSGPAGRPGTAAPLRDRGRIAHWGWIAAALVVTSLGWVSPVLPVVVAVAVGIGWLCITGADPVHWRPAADAGPGQHRLRCEEHRTTTGSGCAPVRR